MLNGHGENEEWSYLFVLWLGKSNDKTHIFAGEVSFEFQSDISKLEVAPTTRIFSDFISKVSFSSESTEVSEIFEIISKNSVLTPTTREIHYANI